LKQNDKWFSMYSIDSLENKYQSSTAINNSGFYFTANGKAYYSDYNATTRILHQYEQINSVHKGPKNTIIFELGRNVQEAVGLIYNVIDKSNYPIYIYKLNNRFQSYRFTFIKYRDKTNSILVLTNVGLYEVSVDDIMNFNPN